MYRCIALSMVLFVAGCGVETATTAATVAAARAEEAKQAQNKKAQIQKRINAAMASGQQRLQDADNAGQ